VGCVFGEFDETLIGITIIFVFDVTVCTICL